MNTELGQKQQLILTRISLSLKPLELFEAIGYVSNDNTIKIIIKPTYIFKDMMIEDQEPETYVFEAEILDEGDITDQKIIDSYANSVVKSVLQLYVMGGREIVHGPAAA